MRSITPARPDWVASEIQRVVRWCSSGHTEGVLHDRCKDRRSTIPEICVARENGIMTVWRLRKVPFGVNCLPFLLTAVLQHHLKTVRETATDEETKAINTMLESFYVDDCVSSESSKEAATNFKRISGAKLAEAGMELRKWRMNEGEDAKKTTGKVLGLNWCTQTDRVSLAALESLEPPKMWTSRTLLQAVATAFDPLGLVAAVLLVGNMLLQRTWTEKGTWDMPLSPSLTQAVADWWGAIGQITEVRVPRWIEGMIDTPVTLHLFADASEKGYGCCIYVTTQDKTHLIFAKCKVEATDPGASGAASMLQRC